MGKGLCGLVVLGLSLACFACDGDEADPGGNGGAAGSAGSAGSGNAGAGGTAGSGASGGSSAGSGGSGAGGTGAATTGGAGGTSGAAGSGAGGSGGGVSCETYKESTICSAPCDAFPVTLDLGGGIAQGSIGAALCYAEAPAVCFGTNNTYSDGPVPCVDDVLLFTTYVTTSDERWVRTRNGWHFVSISHGSIEASEANYAEAVPDSTQITAVINDGSLATPGSSNYQVVFTYTGATITFTSVEKL